MPIFRREIAAAARTYGTPFVGPVDHTVQLLLVLSGLTSDEIDEYGYLKPGVPFMKDGTTVGADPDYVYGVTIEAIKVADDNLAPTIAALANTWVSVATIGQVNKAAVEDMLGRALTANEIAGFTRAGSKLVLIG